MLRALMFEILRFASLASSSVIRPFSKAILMFLRASVVVICVLRSSCFNGSNIRVADPYVKHFLDLFCLTIIWLAYAVFDHLLNDWLCNLANRLAVFGYNSNSSIHRSAQLSIFRLPVGHWR